MWLGKAWSLHSRPSKTSLKNCYWSFDICIAFVGFTGATSCPVEVMKDIVSKLKVSQLSVISFDVFCSYFCRIWLPSDKSTGRNLVPRAPPLPASGGVGGGGGGRGDTLGTGLHKPSTLTPPYRKRWRLVHLPLILSARNKSLKRSKKKKKRTGKF